MCIISLRQYDGYIAMPKWYGMFVFFDKQLRSRYIQKLGIFCYTSKSTFNKQNINCGWVSGIDSVNEETTRRIPQPNNNII